MDGFQFGLPFGFDRIYYQGSCWPDILIPVCWVRPLQIASSRPQLGAWCKIHGPHLRKTKTLAEECPFLLAIRGLIGFAGGIDCGKVSNNAGK